MICFITAVEAYPRVRDIRTPDRTTITYTHRHLLSTQPAPRDKGLVISPVPHEEPEGPPSSRPEPQTEWIFDTGAMSHVCCNPSLMHSTVSFAHGPYSKATANFGPNPVAIRGVGNVTLDAAVPLTSIGRSMHAMVGGVCPIQGDLQISRVTINNVAYIPEAGVESSAGAK